LQNWSAGSVFNNSGGTATFNTDAGSAGATLTVNAITGSVVFASTQHLAGLNISAGATAKLTSSGSVSVLVTSSLSVGGALDLTDNAMDVSSSSLSAITALVAQGYSNGTWTGIGITSSTAAADTTHLTTLGVIQNNQSGSALFTASNPFEGITPSAGDVLVKYTYYGDADLNGEVDGSDYSRIDNGYLNQLTGWFNGDFNYDGVINGSDYTLIDNSFNTQGAQLDAEATASSVAIAAQVSGASASAVPEPAGIAVMFAGCLGLLSRRNRAVVRSGLAKIRRNGVTGVLSA
jgi:hypothetical protein